MFAHVCIGSNDLDKSRSFYDAVFTAMGAQPGMVDTKGRLIYVHNGGRLLITKPVNGEPATYANGGTLGFTIDNAELVDAWHDAGVAHGGTSCEDPPGVRSGPNGGMYLAYLRDPDGNKLCGIHKLT